MQTGKKSHLGSKFLQLFFFDELELAGHEIFALDYLFKNF